MTGHALLQKTVQSRIMRSKGAEWSPVALRLVPLVPVAVPLLSQRVSPVAVPRHRSAFRNFGAATFEFRQTPRRSNPAPCYKMAESGCGCREKSQPQSCRCAGNPTATRDAFLADTAPAAVTGQPNEIRHGHPRRLNIVPYAHLWCPNNLAAPCPDLTHECGLLPATE